MHIEQKPSQSPSPSPGNDFSVALPSVENSADIIASIAPKFDQLSWIRELSASLKPLEFQSIDEGAARLAASEGSRDYLALSSKLAETLMSKEPLSGETRRFISQAQREATALAGTRPTDTLHYLSRYNFLAYHLERATESLDNSTTLAA